MPGRGYEFDGTVAHRGSQHPRALVNQRATRADSLSRAYKCGVNRIVNHKSPWPFPYSTSTWRDSTNTSFKSRKRGRISGPNALKYDQITSTPFPLFRRPPDRASTLPRPQGYRPLIRLTRCSRMSPDNSYRTYKRALKIRLIENRTKAVCLPTTTLHGGGSGTGTGMKTTRRPLNSQIAWEPAYSEPRNPI